MKEEEKKRKILEKMMMGRRVFKQEIYAVVPATSLSLCVKNITKPIFRHCQDSVVLASWRLKQSYLFRL